MIVRQTPNALKIFLTLRGSVIPKVYPQILLIAILSTLITIIQHWLTKAHPEPPEVVANIIVQSRYTAAYHLFSNRPLGDDIN